MFWWFLELLNAEVLDLAFTNISNAGLLSLAENSRKLKRLTLSDNGIANLWVSAAWTSGGLEEFKYLRCDVHVDLVST